MIGIYWKYYNIEKLKEYLDKNSKNTKLKEEISNGMELEVVLRFLEIKDEVGDSFYESFVILFFIGLI
jgi:hypothetical protein